MGCFVLPRSGDAALQQRLDDPVGRVPVPSQLKDQANIGRRLLVRLHPPVGPLPIAVGTSLALVLAAPELHILGALILDGQVPAVKLADQIFERYVDAAGVSVEGIAVKLVVDGNEADAIQWEYHLHKVANLDAVAAKAGEILYDDTVDGSRPHLVKQVLDGWPFKVGPAVPIVYKLQDLHIFYALHGVNVLMKRMLLVLDAEAAHLAVLCGETDIERDHIRKEFIHTPAPPGYGQSRFQRQNQWIHRSAR